MPKNIPVNVFLFKMSKLHIRSHGFATFTDLQQLKNALFGLFPLTVDITSFLIVLTREDFGGRVVVGILCDAGFVDPNEDRRVTDIDIPGPLNCSSLFDTFGCGFKTRPNRCWISRRGSTFCATCDLFGTEFETLNCCL